MELKEDLEVWLDIKGYENKYQISNLGRVRSINYHNTGRINLLKPAIDKKGYLRCALSKNNILSTFKVHRLVAEHFIKNDNPSYNQVNHKNGIKTDNRVENLEWCNNSMNQCHAWKIGLQPTLRKRKLYKYKDKIIILICNGYKHYEIDKLLNVCYGTTKHFCEQNGIELK